MAATHRRALLACAAVAAALLAAGCSSGTSNQAQGGTSDQGQGGTSSQAQGASSPTARPTSGTASCDFTATPGQPAPQGHDEGVPPKSAPRAGAVTVTMHTSQGDIPATMTRADAPCTVASFAFLAGKHYFDATPCHRLTDYPKPNPLFVLQCGDPTGKGTGGPGYTIPDENPTGLAVAPGSQSADVYPRGTIAMANTGAPHSGGSQFFLVYQDSYLPPNYSVFGQVSSAGLTVLDKIAKNGIVPGSDPSTGQPTPNDGKPKQAVTITSVAVSG